MPPLPDKNVVIIAAAGSRKTTSLVETALADYSKNILLATYTNENLEEIRNSIICRVGSIPAHITICSLFTFLFQEGVRPYQRALLDREVRSINFVSDAPRYIGKYDVNRFYLDRDGNVYRDRLSSFVVDVNKATKGLVIDRLERIYDAIYIDEVQDLAGYDLDVLELLFRSRAQILAVGDPRQWTYSTNLSNRHKGYRGAQIIQWIQKQERNGLCVLERRKECYRCNQEICDFADKLYPRYERTISKSELKSDHFGVFAVRPELVHNYVKSVKPKILRYDKNSNTFNYPAINFGLSKGRSYDHVLIVPTKPIKNCICTGDFNALNDMSRAKLYVAITRARHSVAFVHEGDCDAAVSTYVGAE